ncbi:serpin family protein [Arthrobacter sp. SX1312]|uniref:serpin family protein n=1 Tax=Arthrobacter sp. SX1312 TaxID=2058896 RepID=UPI0015E22184|nr:serpin family protein [Arthrobacter sp. SX1312]
MKQFRAPVARTVVEPGRYADAEEALRRSAFRLGVALTARPDTNQVSSPVSALYALSMLRAGAGSTTAAEMDLVLGLPVEHHAAMNALLATVQYFDGDPVSVDEEDLPGQPLVHLANAVFVPEGGEIGEAFLATLARYYGAGVHPVDFADPATPGLIDDWVWRETGGRVARAPLAVGADTGLSMLNAVYFAAAWDEPFDASGTGQDPFILVTGTRVLVPTMHGYRWVRYAVGPDWQGIDLPYGGGFFLRLVLPAEGVPPAWDEQELAGIADGLDAAESIRVDLSLPTWEHSLHLDLIGVLAGLGLAKTVGPGADFDAIHPGLRVSGAAQAATITVAEKGTIAAAVTQLAMMTSAPVPPEVSIAFDRPFGYQIIHEDTGLPLFLGTVADPR